MFTLESGTNEFLNSKYFLFKLSRLSFEQAATKKIKEK